jgi:hypothetical protein
MNQWGNKDGCELVSSELQYIEFLPCFHLNHLESGKDDSLSEARLQSSKNCRGSFLDPEKAINPLLTALSAAFLQEERQ